MIEPCEQYRSHLEAYVDEELPDDQIHDLESHIAECECCRPYRAELEWLRNGLSQLAFTQETPNLSEVVVCSLRRRFIARFVLASSFVVVLKVLDVFGVFGSGVAPRLIVAAGAMCVLCLLKINPLRIVRPEEILPWNQNSKGVEHANG